MRTDSLPNPRLLRWLYRLMMNVTHRHGFHTLAKVNARIFGQGVKLVLESGTTLFVPPDPHFFGYLLGHESHITNRLSDVIRPGDVCVDVGANIGYFTLMMAGYCRSSGKVYAYEPEQENFAVLSENVNRINREHDGHVVAIRNAVSSSKGYLALDKGMFSTLHKVREIKTSDPKENRVKCVRLDEDLTGRGERGIIRIIKIDVEGHEAEVLKGCRKLLEEGRIDYIVTEVFPGKEATELAGFIEDWASKAEAWIDKKWQSFDRDLPSRTDVWIEVKK